MHAENCIDQGSVCCSLPFHLCRSYVEGKTVVEVGAGLGLASIACAMSGACHTVATDGDDDLLLLARENMVANAPTLVHAGKLRTHTLMW